MILIRAIYLLLVLFFATFSMSYTLADTHDTNASTETSEEEALPLNDPFAGDESLSSGTNIISGSEEEREAMSLYKFKLVGIIEGEYEAYATLVDASGEILSLTLHEELSAGVKLIDSVDLHSNLANIGDTRSLILHPASTTHRQLTEEQRNGAGASSDAIRLSVGIEDVNDIIADLDQALSQV